MGIFGFGRYRTVKLRIPRKCEWCEARLEKLTDELEVLVDRVNQLEANATIDQSIQLIRMKLETGTQIFLELVKGQAPVTITQAQLDGMLGLYTDIIATNERILGDLLQGVVPRNHNRPPNPSSNFTSPTSGSNGHNSHALPSQS